MVDSELYEDAQSKIEIQSKSNNLSSFQEVQSKFTNRMRTRKSDSSVYQDAQSKITNNSNINSSRLHKKSLSNINKDKYNEVEFKNDYLKLNNIYKLESNEEPKISSRNIKVEKKYKEDEINDETNNIENKKSESLYEEPSGSQNEEIGKTNTIFEGMTRKGDCCNLPKCIIF